MSAAGKQTEVAQRSPTVHEKKSHFYRDTEETTTSDVLIRVFCCCLQTLKALHPPAIVVLFAVSQSRALLQVHNTAFHPTRRTNQQPRLNNRNKHQQGRSFVSRTSFFKPRPSGVHPPSLPKAMASRGRSQIH